MRLRKRKALRRRKGEQSPSNEFGISTYFIFRGSVIENFAHPIIKSS